jgi:hypothetical protein
LITSVAGLKSGLKLLTGSYLSVNIKNGTYSGVFGCVTGLVDYWRAISSRGLRTERERGGENDSTLARGSFSQEVLKLALNTSQSYPLLIVLRVSVVL